MTHVSDGEFLVHVVNNLSLMPWDAQTRAVVNECTERLEREYARTLPVYAATQTVRPHPTLNGLVLVGPHSIVMEASRLQTHAPAPKRADQTQ